MIESEQVVKLILQFLHELGLHRAYRVLAEDSGLSVNLLPDPAAFLADIRAGRWESVLRAASHLVVPASTRFSLVQQVVLETLERQDYESAQLLFQGLVVRRGDQFQSLLHEVKSLERKVASKARPFAERSRQDCRDEIAWQLQSHLSSAERGRLVTLIAQALKYQEDKGVLLPGLKTDLMTLAQTQDEPRAIRGLERELKFPEDTSAESILCTARFLVLGMSDGLVQVYDPVKLQLHKDLAYQADSPLSHRSAVTALGLDRHEEALAAGDSRGTVKIWRVKDGKLIYKEELAVAVGGLLFCQQDTVLLASGEKQLLWLGLAGRLVVHSQCKPALVNAIAKTKAGAILVGLANGTIQLYNTSRTPVRSFQLTAGEQLTNLLCDEEGVVAGTREGWVLLNNQLGLTGRVTLGRGVEALCLRGEQVFAVVKQEEWWLVGASRAKGRVESRERLGAEGRSACCLGTRVGVAAGQGLLVFGPGK